MSAGEVSPGDPKTDPCWVGRGLDGAPGPAGRYRLEIYLPPDIAPHFAYRWAGYSRRFAYFASEGAEVKIVTSWITSSDPDVAYSEFRKLNDKIGLLPRAARWVLVGPITGED